MPGFPRLQEAYDLVVVGGGHAGLQAGLKAARLNQTAAVLDRGPKYSRSFYAPRMDNIPGFPQGISGHQLLDHQIAQLRAEEARVGYFTPALAIAARRTSNGFAVEFEWLKQRHVANGRVLVLAMGVVDRLPEIGGKLDTIFPWANQGLVYFCLFCDAHEFEGKRVAVIGDDAFAARTALDLRHWAPKSLEILTHGRPFLGGVEEAERTELVRALDEAKIPHHDGTITALGGLREKEFHVTLSDGSTHEYDRGFSALPWYTMHDSIPRSLGCSFDPDGFVVTDEDCRAIAASDGRPIPGLYCIGDLRNGWNQIPEAWATAERAVIHAYASYL